MKKYLIFLLFIVSSCLVDHGAGVIIAKSCFVESSGNITVRFEDGHVDSYGGSFGSSCACSMKIGDTVIWRVKSLHFKRGSFNRF